MKVAIIGSGPGGMIVSKVLTENGISVSLFEKGRYFKQSELIPFSAEELDEKYKHGGVSGALGKPSISYVEGECLGGGSEVNSGLYHRTPEMIFDHWGISSFKYNDLISYFCKIEKELNVCKSPFQLPKASLKLKHGADILKWRCEEVPRWYRYESNTDKGIYSGKRQSMTEAILPKINKDLLEVKDQTNVIQVFPNSKNVGVKYIKDKKYFIEHFEYIFICAGAINTPQLLKKSKFKNKNIGKNLKLHPSIKITAEFQEKINFKNSGVAVHQVKEFSPNYSFGCSISSPPHLAVNLLDNSIDASYLEEKWQYMSTYYSMVTDGFGSVNLTPFFKEPLVTFNLGEAGFDNITEGLLKLGNLLFESGASTLYPSIKGVKGISCSSEWNARVTGFSKSLYSLMTVHLMQPAK